MVDDLYDILSFCGMSRMGYVLGVRRPSVYHVQDPIQRCGFCVIDHLSSIVRLTIFRRATNYLLMRWLSPKGFFFHSRNEIRTSPKTWLISGLVIKSPCEPKTGFVGFW